MAGGAAGAATALLHTRCGVNRLLSGILVMTALYSVNLRIMGKSNIPLLTQTTLMTHAESLSGPVFGSDQTARIGAWEVPARDLSVLLAVLLFAVCAGTLLYAFFQTNVGLAMRAVGDNSQMIRALGVDVGWMTTFGLVLANAFVGLAGALLAQYQGFADVQMGIGMLVWGLASVILGESLVGTRQIGFLIVGAIMGSVLFRLLVAIALRWGLDPNDLKLVTAAFVFAALVLPRVIPVLTRRRARDA
jgi:putative ABC transport system permease protein